jgi:arsenite/tail-anchored protein-transporting ATPase
VTKRTGTHSSTREALPRSRSSQEVGLPPNRFLFFGGKGGVGKTTAAAAAAIFLLQHSEPPQRILLFSTDPAHSLSDSLDVEVGDRLVEVAHRGRSVVVAREMNPSAALARFKEKHRATIAEIADRGTLLDKGDVNELLNLSLPGMDEVMALFELSQADREGAYTRVVVDTAPSGHTSRLLRLPDVFGHWISALDQMAEKHRFMVSHFGRGRRQREDEVELFLKDLAKSLEQVRAVFFDRERASFTLVTIPEGLSVAETSRYFEFLRDQGVPVTDLIINRVEREHSDCPYCRRRASAQKPWLAKAAREFSDLRIHRVELFPEEVRGPKSLRRFASAAWEAGREPVIGRSGATAPRTESAGLRSSDRDALPFSIEPRRLLIFGGKGGVGKTTLAAASALALAKGRDGARVLIFSTDPAHSLSDSFNEEIGELKRGVSGLPNLDGMEIDPARRFEEFKSRYRAWTDESFSSLTEGSRWEIQFDREAIGELMALAPPGIDEIAALSVISELLEEGDYTTIVLDTAPTGHLVRFLELPDIALSWVRTLMRLLLKYKEVVRVGSFAEDLVALSRNIKRVAAMISNAKQCEFVGVAIPERMSLEETARLADALTRLKVAMRRLLVNNVIAAEASRACEFCGARRRGQQKVIKEFQKRLGSSVTLFTAPQQPHEVRGPRRLGQLISECRQLSVREVT